MLENNGLDAAIVRYCKYQERCHVEVRNKLYELGFTTAMVEEHLSKLIEADILNEERFAKAYARGKFRMKQWGRVKIKSQLKLRKISDYCIKKGLSEIDLQEYEQVISKLMHKKYNELTGEKHPLIRKQKTFRYMMQKGYEQDIVADVLKAGEFD